MDEETEGELGKDKPGQEGQQHLHTDVELGFYVAQFVDTGNEEDVADEVYHQHEDEGRVHVVLDVLGVVWRWLQAHIIHEAHVDRV